jgi:hypothetical protein
MDLAISSPRDRLSQIIAVGLEIWNSDGAVIGEIREWKVIMGVGDPRLEKVDMLRRAVNFGSSHSG